MVTTGYAAKRHDADLLEVVLSGQLNEDVVAACAAEVRAELSVVRPGEIRVLINLESVQGYSLAAREALTALQERIGRKASQTAFCALGREGHGLALWVCHMTREQVIERFRKRDEAIAWLSGNVLATTGVRPIVRASEPPQPFEIGDGAGKQSA